MQIRAFLTSCALSLPFHLLPPVTKEEDGALSFLDPGFSMEERKLYLGFFQSARKRQSDGFPRFSPIIVPHFPIMGSLCSIQTVPLFSV